MAFTPLVSGIWMLGGQRVEWDVLSRDRSPSVGRHLRDDPSHAHAAALVHGRGCNQHRFRDTRRDRTASPASDHQRLCRYLMLTQVPL
jgi:hypothetical protein